MELNKTDYKRLGDYIREVDVRNRDLKVTKLLGVSVSKEFMSSIANTIGTDMSTYKIVKYKQFVYIADTSRRGDKIAIALLTDNENAIVSQAYTVFEVIDDNRLLPEYLMMWFRRPEFDRYARFHSHGSAREIFDWDEMCDVILPIPPIERQREIVSEYETLSRRIELNNKMISRLEETAQTLYRKMFVDGIDKENLPDGWRMGTLGDLVEIIDGDRSKNYPKEDELDLNGHCLFLNTRNVTKNGFNYDKNFFISYHKDSILKKGKLKRHDIVFTTRGTIGNYAYYSIQQPYNNVRINSGMVILRCNTDPHNTIPYILEILSSNEFQKQVQSYLSGSAQPQLPIKDFNSIPILIPVYNYIYKYSKTKYIIINYIETYKKEIRLINKLQTLILDEIGK